MDYKTLSDDKLVSFVKAGDSLAFKEVYLRYWKEMFDFCRKKTDDPAVAEEIVQNVFISLWDNRHKSDIRQLKNYLYTALRYGFINHLKKQLVVNKYVEYKKADTLYLSNPIEEAFALKELSLKIEESINSLPVKTGEIFRMSRYEKRSVKEISTYFNLTEKAVEYHITRSLRTLRIMLKDYILVLFWLMLK